jgi:predicted NBD/HSP70 family sugar kinase
MRETAVTYDTRSFRRVESTTGSGTERRILERATQLQTGRFAVGIEVLPERLVAVLTDQTGDRKGKRRRVVVNMEPRLLACEIGNVVREIVHTELGLALPNSNVVIGVQLGAPVDSGEGLVLHYRNPSSGSRVIWPEPVPLAEYVQEETGCRVVIENDAASYAVYEQKRGGHDASSFALILMRDGVGGAVVLDDRVVPCPLEVGHLTVRGGARDCRCGRSGCIDSVAGMRAITEIHAQHVGSAPAEFAHLAQSSDDTVVKIFERAGEGIAQGVGAVVTLFGVRLVIVYHDKALDPSGNSSAAVGAFRKSLNTFRDFTFPPLSRNCRLETKSLPDVVGAHGAAVVALHRLNFVPLS